MSAQRHQYPVVFRHAAVRLITEQGYRVTEAARNLGINAKMLGPWKRQAERHTTGSRGGNGSITAAHAALLQLRMACEILQPAPFFSPPHRVAIRRHCCASAALAGRGAM
jgi:transposase